MKKAWKLLKWILITLSALILLTVGVLAWALTHPKETYAFIEKHFLPDDLKITWQDLDFNANRIEGLDFRFHFQIEKLLIEKANPLLHVPIEKMDLESSVKPLKFKMDIGNLLIQAPDEIRFRGEEKKEKEPEQNFFQITESILNKIDLFEKHISFEKVLVNIEHFAFLSKEGAPLEFGLKLESAEAPQKLHLSGKMKRSAPQNLDLSLAGDLDLHAINSDRPAADLKIKLSGFNVTADSSLKLSMGRHESRILLKGEGQFAKEKIKLLFSPDLDLKINAKTARLKLETPVSGIPGPVPSAKNLHVELETPLDERVVWSEKPSNFKIKAPIELGFIDKKLKASLQKSCECEFPLTLMAHADGKVWLAGLLDEKAHDKVVLDSRINVENLKNKLFNLDLAAQLKLKKEKTDWIIQPVLDCSAEIFKFRGFQSLFDAYKILIPAPLDVLDGKISLAAKGPVETNAKGSKFPARISVDLSSKRQRVLAQSTASLLLRSDFKKLTVDSQTMIDDLTLELPPLTPIGGKPRVTPDKRVLKNPPAKEKESRFEVDLNLQVQTSQSSGIKLLSEYFKPYLPLTLKIQYESEKGQDGFVQVEPFNVVYFRRKVRVEKLRLDLSESEEGILPVDGRFRVDQTHYTVYIDVKGNAKNPNITMSSDPELPQSEIISVLLYDRTSDELASVDAETAGSVQAAIADRAIGLFGLWAFASTPIKSFSYNPVTKVYTATVDIGNGITASVGTTWESTAQFELRKRVSRKWMLTARWTAATPDENQNTEVVLQWENRF